MYETFEPRRHGGIEQQAQGVDIQPTELIQRAPVAHFGGAVEYPVGSIDSSLERLQVFQVADDRLDPPLVEPAHVTGRPDERADAMAAPECLFGRMTAYEACRARDEDGLR
jgi:hypothetical protein